MERTLADDLRAGRPEALDRLLAEHGREIQAVAFLVLRDADDAADVLAETLVTAWRKAGTIRDPAALRPWLLRVATNRALSRRRTESRTINLRAATAGRVGPVDSLIATTWTRATLTGTGQAANDALLAIEPSGVVDGWPLALPSGGWITKLLVAPDGTLIVSALADETDSLLAADPAATGKRK